MQGFINERAFGETLIYHFAQFPRHFEYLEERHPADVPLPLQVLQFRIVSRPPSGERYFSFYGGAENFQQFFRFFLDYFLEFGGRNGFFCTRDRVGKPGAGPASNSKRMKEGNLARPNQQVLESLRWHYSYGVSRASNDRSGRRSPPSPPFRNRGFHRPSRYPVLP